MKEIKLYTRYKLLDEVALVDDRDYKKMKKYRWMLQKRPTTNYAYLIEYDEVGNKNRVVFMHRFILKLEYGDSVIVDHRNRNGLDNRRCNLRICTNQENSRNRSSNLKWATSVYKGVRKYKEEYKAAINDGDNHIELGAFKDEIHAAIIYNAAATLLFEEFAFLNKIPKEYATRPKRNKEGDCGEGIYYVKKKFMAQFGNTYLGMYNTIEEAQIVRNGFAYIFRNFIITN